MTPQDKKKVAEGMVCFFFGHKGRKKCVRCGKELHNEIIKSSK